MNTKKEHGKIDWMITLVPLAIVIALCVLFFFAPEQSNAVLSQIRFFFGDTFGTYYLVIGLGIFILSLYIAGSKYGNIGLGELLLFYLGAVSKVLLLLVLDLSLENLPYTIAPDVDASSVRIPSMFIQILTEKDRKSVV